MFVTHPLQLKERWRLCTTKPGTPKGFAHCGCGSHEFTFMILIAINRGR